MHITFITESKHLNSLGRTYSLWLLAQELGWDTAVLTTRGEDVWLPVRHTEFANQVHRVDPGELKRAIPRATDLLIACKPLPLSLGYALPVARSLRLPLMVDVDDPDLEARMRDGMPVARFLRALRHPRRVRDDRERRRWVSELPTLVSNPWLQANHGGSIIPHARHDLGAGAAHQSWEPLVVFVGSVGVYKGVPLLRDAISHLKDDGFRLLITADPPDDANPWETWTGPTSFEQGMELVRRADIVALPSLETRDSRGQLPAKLIDSMLAARATVVSDVPPLPWAVDHAGVVVPAGSATELRGALLSLRDPARRESLGERAREHALAEYTVSALAPRFEQACRDALADGRRVFEGASG